MKNGLVALMLLSIVAAIPACRQRDCLDRCRPCDREVVEERVRVEPRKKCPSRCNPCNWFRCKPRCEEEVVEERVRVRKPRKNCPSKCNPCNWFKCKPRCEEEIIEEEVMPMREREEIISRERVIREDIAPAAPRRMIK